MRMYSVYIMASLSRCLYTGMTSELVVRVGKHKRGTFPGFTKKYRITRLVYAEQTSDVRVAIAREKQIKRWPRWRKVQLIEEHNPMWLDLSADWGLDAEESEDQAGFGSPGERRAPGR